jgi:hypothetical protein
VQKAQTNKSQEVFIVKEFGSNVRILNDERDGFSSVLHGCVLILIKTVQWYGRYHTTIAHGGGLWSPRCRYIKVKQRANTA